MDNFNDNLKRNCLKKSCFFDMPAKQFSLLSSIVGLLLIDGLDLDQQNSLGNFLINIGQNIVTSATQETLVKNNNPNAEINSQIEILKKQISLLENQVKKK